MHPVTNRREFLGYAAAASAVGLSSSVHGQQRRTEVALPQELASFAQISVILGRATDRSMTVSVLAKERSECFLELGTRSGNYERRLPARELAPGEPVEFVLDSLLANTKYFYRMHHRRSGERNYSIREETSFSTQRAPGSTFSFCVQGDSHPERPQMFDARLYARTLRHAASSEPDFYVCMGDDFSVERVRNVSATTLAEPYLLQRPFLGLVGQSAPLFLVNGNHEQASLFNFNQTDVRHDVAVGAQNARNRFFPTPAPDRFYTGNTEPLRSIGSLKDYCAWTWGDALFVILDNYWHSPALVDNGFQGGAGNRERGHPDRDWWAITLGDAQYQWFNRTLEQSRAKYKFVFAHHVNGSGRGGIEASELFEWGGKNKRGTDEFRRYRPRWDMPIHQLMARQGVNVFFQGHDHLYARQERDGVVYQEVPMPADYADEVRNTDAYGSAAKFANSGYLKVTVSPANVTVDYVRCWLPSAETPQRRTGQVAHSYTLESRGNRPGRS
jgi:hypothetical protein